jgi:copper resistance protein B
MIRVAHLACALAVIAWVGLYPASSLAQPTSDPPQPPAAAPTPPADDHSGHVHGQPRPRAATPATHEDHALPHAPLRDDLPPNIPPITDEDRRAAFPDVAGHAVHDNAVHSFVLLDQLEWQAGRGDSGLHWDSKGWIGRDVDRFWFRTEGESHAGGLAEAEGHLLYGRAIAPWWDVVAGIRQDVRPGPAQTWAAVGIQGLAPYWFEVEATAYVSPTGRTHLRLEAEYELLLTNRLVLQPLLELQMYGRSDPGRGIGAGLSTADAGLRLRFEVRREFAPYVGVTWNRKFFGTADLARADGERAGGARLALGVRLWL